MNHPIARSLNEARVKVLSPDKNINGVITGLATVDIEFRDDMYYEYDRDEIGYQLSRLLDLMRVGQIRARRQILANHGIDVRDSNTPHWNAKARRLSKLRDDIAAVGLNDGGEINVASVGAVGFDVKIGSQCLDDMDESEFMSAFSVAVNDMYNDFMVQFKALKREIYGLKEYKPGV